MTWWWIETTSDVASPLLDAFVFSVICGVDLSLLNAFKGRDLGGRPMGWPFYCFLHIYTWLFILFFSSAWLSLKDEDVADLLTKKSGVASLGAFDISITKPPGIFNENRMRNIKEIGTVRRTLLIAWAAHAVLQQMQHSI